MTMTIRNGRLVVTKYYVGTSYGKSQAMLWSSSVTAHHPGERIRKNKNEKQEPTHNSCCVSKNVFGAKRIVSADNLYNIYIISWII